SITAPRRDRVDIPAPDRSERPWPVGDYAIYEHCLPFNVARAYDEARGIAHPRIWTAERDLQMWADLQG
ncbi:MAG: hypothetical protein AAFR40_07755, partial [Pseudomonadota bacterium]